MTTPPARLPLATKIVLLTLLNLSLLAVVAVVVLNWQLRQEFGSFLLATGRERIVSVSRQLALDLQQTPAAGRNQLLSQYSQQYNVTFLLLDNQGEVYAGPEMSLPPEVAERLRRFRGPGRGPFDRKGGGAPGGPGGGRDRPTPPPFLVTTSGPLGYWVGLRIPAPDGERGGSLLLLGSKSLFMNRFFFDPEPWLLIAGISVALSLLCWLPWIRSLTHSVQQMTAATQRIAEGQFDIQVDTHRRDELGSLGISINRMAQQLETYVRGQKRFLGDIAHELRSPLGRMQLALGILERRAQEKDAAYVADLQEEVQVMSQLTDELLAFAKAELKPDSIPVERVEAAPAIEEAVYQETRGTAEIRTQIEPGLQILANREYLVRSIANLIRNAVRYAGDAGPITVTARREGSEVQIQVADSGPGVPEEALEKITTPFYRLESSRDRRKGGTGLGLAIVRSFVEASKGSLILRNRQPSGLEVNVRLPAA